MSVCVSTDRAEPFRQKEGGQDVEDEGDAVVGALVVVEAEMPVRVHRVQPAVLRESSLLTTYWSEST